jgi:hypothetical protein
VPRRTTGQNADSTEKFTAASRKHPGFPVDVTGADAPCNRGVTRARLLAPKKHTCGGDVTPEQQTRREESC